MTTALLLLSLLLPCPQEPPTEGDDYEVGVEAEQEVTPVDEIEPKEAAKLIAEALKDKTSDRLKAALYEYGEIDDKGVVKAITKGLAHKDPEVRTLCLEGLRWNPNKEALNALYKASKSKLIVEAKGVAEEYYHALGQKENKKFLKILTDGLWTTPDSDALRARIHSLGRIREKQAVEELMGLMVQSGGRGRRGGAGRSGRYMREMRVSLIVLTGVDNGENQNDWIKWWNDNKRTLKIDKEPWPLPKSLQRQWDNLWKSPKEKKKGRSLGDDPFEEPSADEEQPEGDGRRKRPPRDE